MSDRPFDDRREQMEVVKTKLEIYQRRYPSLDVAYQYKDWVLDTLARNPSVVEYEYAFMQWLERSQRRANEVSGRVSLDDALAYAPKLATGFKRLVAAFRQDNYISPETIRVYAEEFADLTAEEFSDMCSRAIRHLDKFPTIAALIRLRIEAKGDAATARAEAERRDEEEERRQNAIRTALIEEKIAALPEEEQAALRNTAMEALGTGETALPKSLMDTLVRRRTLSLYEEKYREEEK